MKKVALVLLLLMGLTLFLSAAESEYYVKTLYVEKVYVHELGYKIEYRRPNSMFLAEAYLPLDWFGRPDSPAKLVYANDNAVPFLNIYWKNGEFDHLVLYVKDTYNDLSWGTLGQQASIADKFNLDQPNFEF